MGALHPLKTQYKATMKPMYLLFIALCEIQHFSMSNKVYLSVSLFIHLMQAVFGGRAVVIKISSKDALLTELILTHFFYRILWQVKAQGVLIGSSIKDYCTTGF